MDIATIIGLVAGLALVFFGMSGEGSLIPPSTFFDPEGIAVVLGGTLAATMINYPIKKVLKMFKVAAQAFSNRSNGTPLQIISELAEYADLVRRKGLPALENILPNVENHYLRMGLENAMLERDSRKLEIFLDNELDNMQDRHKDGQEIFYNMGTYAPAFGLLGTVMGLILMMTEQGQTSSLDKYAAGAGDSMASLLSGMGMALVTTFYGVLLANLIFLPIAGKLKNRSADEYFSLSIIKAGILSIHAKEHPLILQEKLLTFVDKSTRELHRQGSD